MTTTDDQAQTPRQVLAAELPNARGRQGLSLDDLAARVRLRSGKLDRTALSKIETGARGVSLDEAILLAVALGISPLHLFIPREDDAFVRVTPAEYVTAATARRWIRGTTPLKGQDDRVYRTEVPKSEWIERNARVAAAEQEVEDAEHRYRVVRKKLDLLTLKRGQLDNTLVRSLGGVMPGSNMAAEEVRLDRRLDVAYDQVAEAEVALDDARQHLDRVKAEEAVG